MDEFDAKFWNLCQAAVWIEFRDKELVDQFAAAPGQDPDGDAYRALHFYPKMWPPDRIRYADLNELHERLIWNSLKALGYNPSDPDLLQIIPAEQWQHISLRPPLALDARDRGKEAWRLVRLKRADVLRLWPKSPARTYRSKYDWDELRGLYDTVREELPDLTERQTVEQIQARYEANHKTIKKKAPSRTALQTYITLWKTVAS